MTVYGWLLDLYEHADDGLVIWMLLADGRRLRLRHHFPLTFYAAGPDRSLHSLGVWLKNQTPAPRLGRAERRDLFIPHPLRLLSVEVENPADQPRLFHEAARTFPDLTYYDADVELGLRFAARTGAFPTAYCRIEYEGDRLLEMRALDSPWDLDPQPCPLRVMELEPDCDPNHSEPAGINVVCERHVYHLALQPARALLINLAALLQKFDPDLLLTSWGDTWLLPRLIELSQTQDIELPLNREADPEVRRKASRTYFSYGQIIYRGEQVHLFGRVHIDRSNAMLYGDYGLEGVLEVGRVTGLPLQIASRVSPGTGISSMQILTALRTDVLVPWHKQQAEREKTALDLLNFDQGGLVYQPVIGLHRDVGEIDFVSMYPSVMVRCNISPECTPVSLSDPPAEEPGLIPQTLAPLLKKRIALKHRLVETPPWDPKLKLDKARSLAHKWLLVTCFGYLGYKNARFGRIESHEAVTSNGREALLRGKEAAEDAGFNILQMYVDGLWVQKPGATSPRDYDDLLNEIAERTGLSIALDGIYRWVAFLPARRDKRMPVPNRYFGVFQDGSIKTRGIEARRHDTPRFISDSQMEALRWLAQAPSVDELPQYMPGALELLRRRLHALRDGRVPLDQLVLGQRLSRELNLYVTPSPAARAAMQLREIGKLLGPGQKVRFLLVRTETGVHAWDLPCRPDPRTIDLPAYRVLFLRAVHTLLQPFGIQPEEVADILDRAATQPEFDLRVQVDTLLSARNFIDSQPFRTANKAGSTDPGRKNVESRYSTV
jgi:DNA polymerase-2